MLGDGVNCRGSHFVPPFSILQFLVMLDYCTGYLDDNDIDMMRYGYLDIINLIRHYLVTVYRKS